MSAFSGETAGLAQIGKYPIVAKLGEGGFGAVYRAHDPNIGRDVAIKILMHSDQANIARFRMEAATAGNLNHPNIVTVYDFGEHDGRPYIVMQLLDGEDLQPLAADGSLRPLVDVMNIMSQTSAGLHYAHERGVVHRDVKPANIRLLPDHSVKIMDFGIARITESIVASLTEQGNIVGSLRYMAPERFDGGPCDRRVDIFAYGIVYYQLLTGIHPFDAQALTELIQRIRTVEPAPIRSINPQCPPELDAAILRALVKNPAERYQTLHDFDMDVDRTLRGVRRAYASELAGRAAAFAREGKTQEADGLVIRALKLDSDNEAARQLRDELRRIQSGAMPVYVPGSAAVATTPPPAPPAIPEEPRATRSAFPWKPAAAVASGVVVVAALIFFGVTRMAGPARVQQPPAPPPSPVQQVSRPAPDTKPVPPESKPVEKARAAQPPAQSPAPARTGKPRLFSRPAALSFVASEGDGVTPFKALEISPGEAQFSFTALPDKSWIVQRSGQDRAPGQVHIAVNPAGLPRGEHRGRLSILSEETAGGPITIDIRLTVN